MMSYDAQSFTLQRTHKDAGFEADKVEIHITQNTGDLSTSANHVPEQIQSSTCGVQSTDIPLQIP